MLVRKARGVTSPSKLTHAKLNSTHPMTRTVEQVVIGIDVAQHTLETAFVCHSTGRLLERASLANTAAGHHDLICIAQRYGQVHVVMEATGNYHLRLVQALDEAGLSTSVVNPLSIKRFGQMHLRRTKTDKSDAALIAAYGQDQKPEPDKPKTSLQQQLQQIASVMGQLTKQRTALKNLQHAARLIPSGSAACAEVLQQQLEQLERALEELQREQERLVKSGFASANKLARSVKGVGPKTASTLIACAGDLSGFDNYRQLIAFIGLDPKTQQSGTSLNVVKHISKQGHARLRTLFYMGAHSARKHNRACRELYERLIARGKKKKVALIAVAGKLVKQVFAVVKSGVAFDNNYNAKTATVA